MSEANIINIENHRSRKRIRDMGEVFTPDQYVRQMLNLFDNKIWSDESTIFFEPTVGHGNILVPIFQRRIESLEKKYARTDSQNATAQAVAISLNTLWGIDICADNINLTRTRMFTVVAMCLGASGFSVKSGKSRNYLGHVLCTLLWQVHANEFLSSISNESTQGISSQTKVSRDWLRRHDVNPIDFSNDWCTHFRKEEAANRIPAQFLRALRFVDNEVTGGQNRGFDEFSFAKGLIAEIAKGIEDTSPPRRAA